MNQVLAADDQELVEALATDSPDPALGDGVGIGRANRCEDDLDTGRAPDTIERVGARYSVTSCGLRILMDQPTESISSHDASSRQDDRWFGGSERWCLPQRAVRAVAVVMVDVVGQHRPQLPAAQDQHPVQQLPPDGAHPAFGEGVRTRGLAAS